MRAKSEVSVPRFRKNVPRIVEPRVVRAGHGGAQRSPVGYELKGPLSRENLAAQRDTQHMTGRCVYVCVWRSECAHCPRA